MSHTDKPTTVDILATDPGLLPELVGDDRWELVLRIASTTSFKKSPRLRQFLMFVAERSLTGHPEDITEQNIGWRVFERKPDYNPSDDSIVRTTARQLRLKVKEYFDSEGRDEIWILEIPKGHYSPIFAKKEEGPVATSTTPPAPASTSTASAVRRWQFIAGGIALIAICASVFAYQSRRQAQRTTPSATSTIVSTILRQSQEPTRVVVGDYGAILMSAILKRPVSVEEYANRTYLPPFPEDKSGLLLRGLWTRFGNGQMVPLGDVGVAGAIERLSVGEKKQVVIQHAREITARELRSGNFILLNTPLASPWMSLFEDKLNFQYRVRMDQQQQILEPEFVNTHPLPGEKSTYVAASTTPNFGITYGLIARVSNLTKTGKVLLIMGLRFTGGEAAGEYATAPESAIELARLLNVRDISEAPDFEVLVETYSLDASPRDIKVVAFRRH